jgi:hypothetical protein
MNQSNNNTAYFIETDITYYVRNETVSYFLLEKL